MEVPAPQLLPGQVLVRTAVSAVSAGTERMVTGFAGKSLLGKARSRPDLVADVIRKARRDGVLGTAQLVRNRLDTAFALGYSSAGIVDTVSNEVVGLARGDRVACAGG